MRHASVVLVATFVALIAAAHVLARELEPTQHMLSEYVNAVGLAGPAAVLGLLCWALSWLVVAATTLATGRTGPSPHMNAALAGCLALAGIGLTVAAVFPTDAVQGAVPPGAELSTAGRLHDLGGGAAQLALLVSAALSLRVLERRDRFQALTIVLIAASLLLGPIAAVADLELPGLRQRITVSLACIWQLALIAALTSHRRARRVVSS